MSFTHCDFNTNIVKMANASATEILAAVEEEHRGSAPVFLTGGIQE